MHEHARTAVSLHFVSNYVTLQCLSADVMSWHRNTKEIVINDMITTSSIQCNKFMRLKLRHEMWRMSGFLHASSSCRQSMVTQSHHSFLVAVTKYLLPQIAGRVDVVTSHWLFKRGISYSHFSHIWSWNWWRNRLLAPVCAWTVCLNKTVRRCSLCGVLSLNSV